MTSSRFRSLPSARRTSSPSPPFPTAIPAESYPRYSRRRSPSMMTGTTLFLPTYPTMPHITPPQQVPCLLGQGITEFFDDRIGQYFAGDSFDFRLRLFGREFAIQLDFKILALPHALQAFVAHLLE